MRTRTLHRALAVALLLLTLGACAKDKTAKPSSAKATTTAAPASTAATVAPQPVKQVPTRLTVTLIDPSAAPPATITAAMTIARRLSDCWRAPEAADAPAVTIQLALNQDGSVRMVTVLNKQNFAADAGYRAAATTATSAFLKCSPFALSPADYASWNSLALLVSPHHG